ncbi:MAG: ABC transporter ATP-binding protein [Clostridiales bacterium]
MENILEVSNLNVSFKTHNGKIKAIRGVDFELHKGETFAIVGESGSGKSVTAKVIMGILSKNGNIDKGKVIYKGNDLTKLNKKELVKIRGKEISMIFQDPMTSLNPTLTIGYQILECLIEHQNFKKREAKLKVLELLELVGIDQPQKRYKQYPHQLSGGMRQRVVIAISLACNPKILIADEPTTALDVTIQSQIIELIKDLQIKIDLSIIFITHDLGIVANVADRIAVMYAGKIVEYGTTDEIFYDPKHPYTWGLLASVPDMDDRGQELYSINGTPPNLLYPPKGDAFAVRNEFALNIDLEEQPPFFKISDTHFAATWLLHDEAPKTEKPSSLQKRIQVMKGEEYNGKK